MVWSLLRHQASGRSPGGREKTLDERQTMAGQGRHGEVVGKRDSRSLRCSGLEADASFTWEEVDHLLLP